MAHVRYVILAYSYCFGEYVHTNENATNPDTCECIKFCICNKMFADTNESGY